MKRIFFAVFCFFLIQEVFSQSVVRTMRRLPDTGQNLSFTLTYGEDSDFLIDAPYFLINGDGTVTDTVTGLMWMSADWGEMTFENARIYADTLAFAGHTDWRLPLAGELFSIQHLQHVNPALDPLAFATGTAEYWWSSETQVNDSTKVWVTNSGGGIGNHRRSETVSAGGTKRFHARAVRQPQPSVVLSTRFTDNNDGTVTDHMTDLVWQSVPYGDSLTWEQALSYADTLSLSGETDWRLPNIKELQSLTDLRQYNPSFDTVYLSFSSQGKYWSSTTLMNQPLQAWHLDSRYGITTYSLKSGRNLLVCVRGNTSISTSVPEVIGGNEPVMVFPNPFTDRIRLAESLRGVKVRMTDLPGNIIYEGDQPEAVDFTPLPNGLYLISFPDQHFHPLLVFKQ